MRPKRTRGTPVISQPQTRIIRHRTADGEQVPWDGRVWGQGWRRSVWSWRVGLSRARRTRDLGAEAVLKLNNPGGRNPALSDHCVCRVTEDTAYPGHSVTAPLGALSPLALSLLTTHRTLSGAFSVLATSPKTQRGVGPLFSVVPGVKYMHRKIRSRAGHSVF